MTDDRRLLAIGVPAAGLLFCMAMPPEGAPRYFVCPFLALTGLPCPLCGMTRAMILLGHGRGREALHFHALSPLVMAGLVLWLAAAVLRPGWRPPIPRAAVWSAVALTGVFGILRWWGIIEAPPR